MDCSEFGDEYQDWLEGSGRPARRRVFDRALGEVGEPQFLAVAPDTKVRAVVQRMNAEHAGSALVVEGERLVGIFTERDVLTRVVGPGLDPGRQQVADVMTHHPETLPMDAEIAVALRTMVLGGFRHIPVVDGAGRPVSTVSMRRLINFVSELFAEEVLNAAPVRDSWPAAAEGA